jgi:hypothetical protein
MRRFVWVAVCVAGCVSERGASGPATAEAPQEPVASETPPPAPDAEADAGSPVTPEIADASSDIGPTVDAGATGAKPPEEPLKPLVLKGARKCTDAESAEDYCIEGRTLGMCYESWCITPSNCPRYCVARSARDYADCTPGDPKECAGVPECLKVMKETRATCKRLEKAATDDCLRLTCPIVRSLPSPPPA